MRTNFMQNCSHLPPETATGSQSPRKQRRVDDSEACLAEMEPRAEQPLPEQSSLSWLRRRCCLLSHESEDCTRQLQQPEDCSKHSSDAPMQRPGSQPLKDAGITHPQHVPGDTEPYPLQSEVLCTVAQNSSEAVPATEAAGTLRLQPLDDSALYAFSSEVARPWPEQAAPAEPQVRAAAGPQEAVQATSAPIVVAKSRPNEPAALSQGRTRSEDPKDAACRGPQRQPRVSKHRLQPGSAGRASVRRVNAGRTTFADAPAWQARDWAERGVTGNRAASGAPAGGHLSVAGESWQLKEEGVPTDWVPSAQLGDLRGDNTRQQSGRCARSWAMMHTQTRRWQQALWLCLSCICICSPWCGTLARAIR